MRAEELQFVGLTAPELQFVRFSDVVQDKAAHGWRGIIDSYPPADALERLVSGRFVMPTFEICLGSCQFLCFMAPPTPLWRASAVLRASQQHFARGIFRFSPPAPRSLQGFSRSRGVGLAFQ